MKNPSISIDAIIQLENRLRADYFKALYGGLHRVSNLLSARYDQVAQYRRALERGENPPMPKFITIYISI